MGIQQYSTLTQDWCGWWLADYHQDFLPKSSTKFQVFKFEYAGEDDIPLELFLRGMVSLTLTVLNILCIIGVGVLILFVKQVTPESIPQRNASFWKTDVALNKEYELSRAKEVRYLEPLSVHQIYIFQTTEGR